MNSESNVMSESGVDAGEIAAAPAVETRPLYCSITRELWENRSIYFAPVVVACFVFLGFAMSLITLPHRMQKPGLTPAKQAEILQMPHHAIAGLLVMTAFLVGVFYCLDALHGERRDRSILFWKSLPVSDRTTVLAKLAVPLVVLPMVILPIILVVQLIMLVLSSAVLAANRLSVAALWSHLLPFQTTIALVYALIAVALWHAPLYAWLLLVSAWAKRATLLWAVLPLAIPAMFERIAFGTTYIGMLLGSRVTGWFPRAFVVHVKGTPHPEPLDAMTPLKFLATPGLWIGLIFAAVFVAATIRLRRNREPI